MSLSTAKNGLPISSYMDGYHTLLFYLGRTRFLNKMTYTSITTKTITTATITATTTPIYSMYRVQFWTFTKVYTILISTHSLSCVEYFVIQKNAINDS